MDYGDGIRNRPSPHSVYTDLDDDGDAGEVEELRERLRQMKATAGLGGDHSCKTRKSGIDDGFLSMVFIGLFCIIAFVTIYAFYSLFNAVYHSWSYDPKDFSKL